MIRVMLSYNMCLLTHIDNNQNRKILDIKEFVESSTLNIKYFPNLWRFLIASIIMFLLLVEFAKLYVDMKTFYDAG